MKYLDAVSIELNKAFKHFKDIDIFIDNVNQILNSGLLIQIKNETYVSKAFDIINKHKSKFTLEIERLFFIRILADVLYQQMAIDELPIYDKLTIRLEAEFDDNIFVFMIIQKYDEIDRHGNTCFSNGLIWRIEKVKNPTNRTESLNENIETLTNNESPIIWESDAILLFYLIEWLRDNKFISDKNFRDKIILEHFKDKNGNDFKYISQALKNMRASHTHKPLKYKKILPLLNALKEAKEDSEK